MIKQGRQSEGINHSNERGKRVKDEKIKSNNYNSEDRKKQEKSETTKENENIRENEKTK